MSNKAEHPLRKYRKLARLTQQQLADKATEINKLEKPINTAHVSRIEGFEFALTKDMAIIYTNALNSILETRIAPHQLIFDSPSQQNKEEKVNDSLNNANYPIDSEDHLAKPMNVLIKITEKSGFWLKVLNSSVLSGEDTSMSDRVWCNQFSLNNSITKNPDDIVIIINVGDALNEPNGTIFTIDTMQCNISRAGKYGIYIDDTPMVRSLQVLPNKRVRVLADKDAYPPLELDLDDIKIIGRCIKATIDM